MRQIGGLPRKAPGERTPVAERDISVPGERPPVTESDISVPGELASKITVIEIEPKINRDTSALPGAKNIACASGDYGSQFIHAQGLEHDPEKGKQNCIVQGHMFWRFSLLVAPPGGLFGECRTVMYISKTHLLR